MSEWVALRAALAVGIAVALIGIAAWAVFRKRREPNSARAATRTTATVGASHGSNLGGLEGVNREATRRLWVLAFASPSQAQASEIVTRRVRDNVLAVLQVDSLHAKYFPRRPALMPQLLQALNDPQSASERLSRMVARDPVLTADVLQLANSALYRTSSSPIETIHRAIVVCGLESLRGMLATAMLKPVFRATRKNFPRLPRILWDRTERAARAAEIYAMATHPADRFEAQLAVLLSALGPLVVYSATLDVYARNPHFSPNGDLCVELISEFAAQISLRIARMWQTAPRLLAALEGKSEESLTTVRYAGELLGTLSFLESQTVISLEERCDFVDRSGISPELSDQIWKTLAAAGPHMSDS